MPGKLKVQGTEARRPRGGAKREGARRRPVWVWGPRHGPGDGGHVRYPQSPGEPPPRPETQTGGGEGADDQPPPAPPGADALCWKASRKEAALFVCLWRRSLCALKNPLDSTGQAGSLGRDCFCFIVQIRVQVLKAADTALGNEDAGHKFD